MAENTSPVPNKSENLPMCKCGFALEQIRHLDYGEYRVVFHTGMGCVVGVYPVPKEELDEQV